MDKYIVYDRGLTIADQVVLRNLAHHIQAFQQENATNVAPPNALAARHQQSSNDTTDIGTLRSLNNPARRSFVPTVFLATDAPSEHLPLAISKHMLEPYIRWARKVVRHEADVAMLTHLIIYFIS